MGLRHLDATEAFVAARDQRFGGIKARLKLLANGLTSCLYEIELVAVQHEELTTARGKEQGSAILILRRLVKSLLFREISINICGR